MNLNLFHGPGDEDRPTHRMDRLNRRTGALACYLLEWLGWYNISVSVRLLGHYRLFQLFIKSYGAETADINPLHAYILQYRGTYGLKYFFSRCFSHANFIIMRGKFDHNMQIQGINRDLLTRRVDILQDFLLETET